MIAERTEQQEIAREAQQRRTGLPLGWLFRTEHGWSVRYDRVFRDTLYTTHVVLCRAPVITIESEVRA